MNHLHFHILQQTRRVESHCDSARARISHAQTMREVRDAANVSIPLEIRSLKHSIDGVHRLEQATERRMEELLERQLGELKAASEQERLELRARFLRNDWQFLRGDHANLFRRAERESSRLLREAGHGEGGLIKGSPEAAR